MKYILLELKVPWPMSAISETYNRGHNILELVDILRISQQVKRNGIILNKNSKYDLTVELSNDVRIKKNSVKL